MQLSTIRGMAFPESCVQIKKTISKNHKESHGNCKKKKKERKKDVNRAYWYRWKQNHCYLVSAVRVSSTAEWKNRENKGFSIQKGHESLYKYQENLVIHSECKEGIKEGQTRMMRDTVPGCHDVCSVSCGHRHYIRLPNDIISLVFDH